MLNCTERRISYSYPEDCDYVAPRVYNRFCSPKLFVKRVYKPVVFRNNPCVNTPVYNPCKCVKPTLLNSKGQFFVYVSQKTPYVQMLIEKAQALGLSVSGDGSHCTKGGDITRVQEGQYISFGSSSRFDMNWIRRGEYMCIKGYKPIYDIVEEWNTVLLALTAFAEKNQSKKYSSKTCQKVNFHAGFAVVDGHVRKYDNEIRVKVPVSTLRSIAETHSLRKLTILY